jgi:predicted RNase H-like HicB family nuclease
VKYLVIFEKSEIGFWAYVPDLQCCIAVESSLEEVHELIKEAIVLHLEALREDGFEIPQPLVTSELIEV